MASPFDDLDRKKLDEVQQQLKTLTDQIMKLDVRVRQTRTARGRERGRVYLRKVIRELRETNGHQKLYINQLENELRLRGLE